jgi:hypothetical protein
VAQTLRETHSVTLGGDRDCPADDIRARVFVTQPRELSLVAADRYDAVAGCGAGPHGAVADDPCGAEHDDRRPDCPIRGMFTPTHGMVTGI